MPRHPKPRTLRANTERLDVGPLLTRRGEVVVPEPPGGLLPATEAAWRDYWASPLAQLVTAGTDLMSLRRLFRFYDEHERGMIAYRRKRQVKGSTGQTRLNPALRAIPSEDILALEDRYGLNPRARLTLGIILGDAARSLADLNLELDLEEDDIPDPRLLTLDGRARRVPAS